MPVRFIVCLHKEKWFALDISTLGDPHRTLWCVKCGGIKKEEYGEEVWPWKRP